MAELPTDDFFYPKKPGRSPDGAKGFGDDPAPPIPRAKPEASGTGGPYDPAPLPADRGDLFYPRKPGRSSEGANGFGDDPAPPIPRAMPEVAPAKASGGKTRTYDPPPLLPKDKPDLGKKSLASVLKAGSLDEERGGYEADDFLEPVSDDLKCLTCLCVLRDPVLTGCCGSRMCESCVDALMKSKFTPTCPQCREPKESMMTMLDKKLMREMWQLKVRCTHHGLGCTWTGVLQQRELHLKGYCELELVQCPKMCGKKMPRFRLNEHLEKVCLKRDYRCPHCNQEGSFDDIMESHYPVCEKFPVLCPNRCAYGTIERCKQEWHLNEECPLQRVNCDFFGVGPGCRTKVRRQDLPKHLEDYQVSHLGMMASEMHMLSKENGEIQSEIRENHKSLEELQGEVGALVKTIHVVPMELTMMYKQHKEMKTVWFSPSFYTQLEGYKMCLKVYAIGEPKSQFVAVYPVMQRGEYDDQLTFPANIEVRVQIIQRHDPTGERHERIQTFRYKRCMIGSLGDDEGFSLGWPDFIRRDFLESTPKNGPRYLSGPTIQFWVNATQLVAKGKT